MSAAPELAVADLAESIGTRWRGFVDRWDPAEGIFGWALAADSPLDPVTVELTIGDTPLQAIQTSHPRTDIDSLLGVRVTPGFRFPPSVYARLARLKPRRRALPVRLRFAGTEVYLVGRTPDPTVGELVAAWTTQTLAALAAPESESSPSSALLSRLVARRQEATQLLEQPLFPSAQNEAGQIEAFHIASPGEIWFAGWMTRGAETEFPLALAERKKHAAAASLIQFERRDLSSRFVGVVGVMSTEWTPPATMTDWFIYAGSDARLQLRVPAHTQLIGAAAFLTRYREAQANSIAGDVTALNSIIANGNRWLSGNAAAVGLAAEASLDRLLLVPGFGCFAEGWALAPSRRVAQLELKLGESVLIADKDSRYYRPRPDLASVFGNEPALLSRAGFVVVFRGDVKGSETGSPVLKIIYTDGSSSVHQLDPKILHRFDCMAHSTDVLRWYPSLQQEAFYPSMLGALQWDLRRSVAEPRLTFLDQASRVIIVRLPNQPANQRLCLDFIARLDQSSDPGFGICLIAGDGETMPSAKLLFDELRSATASPLSLVCLSDSTSGFSVLPQLLGALKADRFVYIDRGAILTPDGWLAAAFFLQQFGHSVRFFEFVDDNGLPDRINGAISAAAFGWSTAAFLDWFPSVPVFIRGVFATNGLPTFSGGSQIYASAATRVEAPQPARLAEIIDADLLIMHTNVSA